MLANLLINSVFRSRILTSSAMIAATSAAMAPLAIMSAMNFLTASRSGSTALVIVGGLSLGAGTTTSLCPMT